jgi:hypothetical protein
MPITAFYAALLTMLLVQLSMRVIRQRRAARIEIGDGADRELLRRMRVHANFIEYAPFGLILLGLAESLAAPALLLHALGLTLLSGRVVHAYGLSQTPHVLKARVAGMMLTITALNVAALACVGMIAWRWIA